LHPRTRDQAEDFIKKPAHCLLIIGSHGSGKYALAKALAATLLRLSPSKSLDSYPYFFHLLKEEGKQEIPIDSIRLLITKLHLKTPGDANSVRRVIIIEGAHSLSSEAQNALLKVLEEPSDDTIFLLTLPSAQVILPTITSRSQVLRLLPISWLAARDYYSGTPAGEVKAAWQLSQGSMGLLIALLKNVKDHELKQAIEEIKIFLSQNRYERLMQAESWGRNRVKLSMILEALNRILVPLHHAALQRQETSRAIKLLEGRVLIRRMQKQLMSNISSRLLSLELALKLRV